MSNYNHDPIVPRVGTQASLAGATAITNEELWTSDTHRLYVEQGGSKYLVGGNKVEATVNTTNDTVTTLWSDTPTDNKVTMYHLQLAARQTGGAGGTVGNGHTLDAIYAVKRVSGTTTVITFSGLNVLHSAKDDVNWMNGVGTGFSISTPIVYYKVDGDTNQNITWAAIITKQEI